jgi:uncharacterized membrane protein YecN with MAPEG domain
MIFPAVTAFYTAILALIYLALSIRVSVSRVQTNTIQGDGGNTALIRSMRTHANFAEYVPLLLLMIGLLEAGGTRAAIIQAMLLLLVIARIAHPFGMVARDRSWQQVAFRGVSSMITWLILLAAALLLLLRFA